MQISNCKLQILRGTLGSMAKTPQDGYLRIVMTHHISSLSAFIRTPPRKSAALLPRVNPRLGQLTIAEATVISNVGLPTDRRAAALAVVKNTNAARSSVLGT